MPYILDDSEVNQPVFLQFDQLNNLVPREAPPLTEHDKYCCRVCGLYYPDYLPYGEDGKSGTFDFCDCCGVEWGYADCQPSAAKRYRQRWIEDGAVWNKPKAMPVDWNLAEQLANVPSAFV